MALHDQVARPEAVAPVQDRRRPGRIEANPALVPLLRGQAAAQLPGEAGTANAADAAEYEHSLSSARGILTGLVLSVTMWTAIYACVRLLRNGIF